MPKITLGAPVVMTVVVVHDRDIASNSQVTLLPRALVSCPLWVKSGHCGAKLVRCTLAIPGRRAADGQTDEPPGSAVSTSRGAAGRNEASPCSDWGDAGAAWI